MRRFSLAMVALAIMGLMTMVSCRKPNIGNGNTVAPRTMTFNATTEMGTNKTSLDGLNVNWSAGDQLSINGESFTLSAGAGTTFASFTSDEEVSINAPYYAAYPASAATYDASTLTFNLSATPEYDATEVEIPMAALNYSDMTTVYFKNVVNVLKLQLTGDGTDASKLTSIVLKSTTSNLNGHVAVTFSGDTPNVGAADGTNTTTLSFGDAGLQLTSGVTTNVYIVLPKIAGGDLKIRFNCANEKYMKKEIAVTPDFNAVNNMLTATVLEVNATTSPAAAPSSVTTVAGCSGYIYSMGGTVTLEADAAQEVEYGFVCSCSESVSVPEIDAPNCFKVVGGTADMPGGTTTNFNVDITGLTTGVDYKVRAYAIGENGTVVYASSSDGIKIITGGDGPKALPKSWTDNNGTNPHPFTVASGVTVHFSQGNLQYIGNTATPYWKFADYQFEFLGTTTGQNSADADKTRDLFGWGTSGLTGDLASHATCYQPWHTELSEVDYNPYGSNETNLYDDEAGYYPGRADWGYNAISNGGNTVKYGWRTLTSAEWIYMFNDRTNASSKWARGNVGSCTNGLIILPDDWEWAGDVAPYQTRWVGGASSWSIMFNYTEWHDMEAAGAVFLPAAGLRLDTGVFDGSCHYWSSSYEDRWNARDICAISDYFYPQHDQARFIGSSVRLVRNVTSSK